MQRLNPALNTPSVAAGELGKNMTSVKEVLLNER